MAAGALGVSAANEPVTSPGSVRFPLAWQALFMEASIPPAGQLELSR